MSAGLTLERAWQVYQSANAHRLRALDTERGRIAHLLGFFGQGRQAAGLTFEDVDAYRYHRRSTITIRKTPPTTTTLNREVEVLARILGFAASRGLINANPLASIEYEPEHNIRPVVVGEDLLARVVDVCRGWLRAFVLLAIDSGMRRTEIVKLRWSQVDEQGGLIHLHAAETKTREARSTILSDRALAAIAELPRGATWVFTNPRTGRHYEPTAVTQAFRKTMTDGGVTADGREIWLHDLRRSFVTNSRRSGIPESVIKAMTGHRTSSVFERYNIRDLSDLLRARNILARAHVVAANDNLRGNRDSNPKGDA